MYDNPKEVAQVAVRKLITISLSAPLLKKAQEMAKEENRTKSELLREALRFYIDTRGVRRRAAREQLFAIIDRAQAAAKGVPPQQIRKVVREAIASARGEKQRASA